MVDLIMWLNLPHSLPTEKKRHVIPLLVQAAYKSTNLFKDSILIKTCGDTLQVCFAVPPVKNHCTDYNKINEVTFNDGLTGVNIENSRTLGTQGYT